MRATSTIRLSDVEIALCDTGGDGLPILMLHGSAASMQAFAPQFDSPLAQLHRLVAIDLPGHGASSDAGDPETTYSIRGLAAAVDAVLEHLAITRAVVLGWSLGGHVAIELMHASSRVAGLMLTGSPPVGRGMLAMLRGFHAHWDMLLASKEAFSARDAERFERLCYGSWEAGTQVATILRADGRLRTQFMRSMSRGDCADQKLAVESAGVPVAMVNGADEPIVRLSYVAGLDYANLWEGRCHVIPGAAHAAFRDAPNAYNALLHRFADDVALAERNRGLPHEELARSA